MNETSNPAVVIKVLSGQHAGASQELAFGELAVGSSLDADIVITDPGIAGHHVRLSFTQTKLEIEALEGEVTLNGEAVAQGSSASDAYPSLISVAGVSLEIKRHRRVLFEASPLWYTRGGAVIVILLMLLALNKVLEPSSAARALVSANVHELAAEAGKNDMPANTVRHLKRASAENISAAVQSLRERLNASGIATLDISATSEAVAVSGVVPPAKESDWQATERWFDNNFGNTIVLEARVSFLSRKAQQSPLEIQSVWAGKMPYVIDGRGDKVYEGTKLRDGWLIDKIEKDHVVLRRQAEYLELKL